MYQRIRPANHLFGQALFSRRQETRLVCAEGLASRAMTKNDLTVVRNAVQIWLTLEIKRRERRMAFSHLLNFSELQSKAS